jgi:hypothetical protein
MEALSAAPVRGPCGASTRFGRASVNRTSPLRRTRLRLARLRSRLGSGAAHPCFARLIGIPLRFASVRCAASSASCLGAPLRSRRPVSAGALRCGLRSFLAAPSLRLVATTRLRTTPLVPRFVSSSAGRHRAAGLGHAAGIRPAVPTALLMPDRTLTSLRSFATRYARTR